MPLHLVVAIACLLVAIPSARAFSVQSPVTKACHEPITGEALRRVRAMGVGAPAVAAVTRDEQALLDDLPFGLSSDEEDFAAASLLLGVRDNDLKGNDPLETVELTPFTSDPTLQREHCLRTDTQDEPGGTAAALVDCRAYITERFDEALLGLDSDGKVDPSNRMTLSVALPIRGPHTDVQLPVFYVRMGQAMHAIEDSYTHLFRTPDGSRVTSALNWIEFSEQHLVERRDGHAHATVLDDCTATDAVRKQIRALAEEAATSLLAAALAPGDKDAALATVLDDHLTLDPGCNIDNAYCNAAERAVADSGCEVGHRSRALPSLLALSIVGLALLLRRRAVLVALLACLALPARADEPPIPTEPIVAKPGIEQKEPGREALTPTRAELETTREKKKLGPRVGFAASVSGAVDRPGFAAMLGLRVRLSERWIVGLDTEWNPFLGSENGIKLGVVNVAATGILRYPLTFHRVNLRSTLSLGTSIQLFDVYGAQRGSVGVYAGVSLLGVDFDVGHYVRVVIDPTNISIPAPHLTGVPFYYIQYRITVGITWGA